MKENRDDWFGRRIEVILDGEEVLLDDIINDVVLPLEVDQPHSNEVGLLVVKDGVQYLVQVPGPQPEKPEEETTKVTFRFDDSVSEEQEKTFLEETKEFMASKGVTMKILGSGEEE